MALEFLTDAEIGDSELVIRLDLDGLRMLMRTLEAAVEARLERVALQGPDGEAGSGIETARAFGRVSVVLVEAAPEESRDALPDRRGQAA
jgi:hypothetical protein